MQIDSKELLRKFVNWLDQHERLSTIVLAAIVGVLSGYLSILLRILIESVGNFHLTADYSMTETLASRPFFGRLLPPLIGLTSVVILIRLFSPESRGSGIPMVIEAVAVKRSVIRPRVALIKTIATGLTLGAGGSGGSEGPVVQIGAAAGSTLGQWSQASHRRLRILLACGASGALAATFNAPIAAVLFSIEVIIDEYSVISFSPVIVAAVMATAISHAHFGRETAIIIPEALQFYSMVSGWELLTFSLLGIICGALSVFFAKAVFATDDFFQKLQWPFWLESFLGALIVSVLIALIPNVAGVGYETIDSLLNEDMTTIFLHDSLNGIFDNLVLVLVVIFLIKIIATSITLGIGASAGIFGPSLFLGAVVGYIYGMLLNQMFPDLISFPPAYALMGMGAFVAGATHTPMTSIVILFEMTGDLSLIVPDMLACIFATLIAISLNSENIFTRSLARKGIDVKQGRERRVLRGINIEEIMDTTFQEIHRKTVYSQFIKMIAYLDQRFFPVVDDDGLMIGLLSLDSLRGHMHEKQLDNVVIAEDLMVRDVVTIRSDESLLDAFEQFNIQDLGQLPVVSPDNPRDVVGLLSRRDLVGVYNRAVLKSTLDLK